MSLPYIDNSIHLNELIAKERNTLPVEETPSSPTLQHLLLAGAVIVIIAGTVIMILATHERKKRHNIEKQDEDSGFSID